MGSKAVSRIGARCTCSSSNFSGWRFLRSSSAHVSTPQGEHQAYRTQRFVDRLRVLVAGGSGGNGCQSFERMLDGRRGKTSGGNGGDGGSVILRVSSNVPSLHLPTRVFRAADGRAGGSNHAAGKKGKSRIVEVPPGTIIHVIDPYSLRQAKRKLGSMQEDVQLGDTWADKLPLISIAQSNSETKNDCDDEKYLDFFDRSCTMKSTDVDSIDGRSDSEFHELSDCDAAGEEIDVVSSEGVWSDGSDAASLDEEENDTICLHVTETIDLSSLPDGQLEIVSGGRGGMGNRTTREKFFKGMDVANHMSQGKPGEAKHLILELKSIADVGLVGYPNAGKSTLLRALSRARPKVAPYPFTTLTPHLGVVEVGDLALSRFTVADIPGIVDGAYRNVGLGHEFLRHIERVRALAFVLDVASTEGRCPVRDYMCLRDELGQYDHTLLGRPAIVIANKVDSIDCDKDPTVMTNLDRLRQHLDPSIQIFVCSAERKRNIRPIIDALTRIVSSSSSFLV